MGGHRRPGVCVVRVEQGAHRRTIDEFIVSPRNSATLPITGRVAMVTGANHGIGAATAVALANAGVDVITYLRVDDPVDPGTPEEYRRQRASGAESVLAAMEALPGRAIAIEADLLTPSVIPELFELAERDLGPVEILVNNASGWVADTFAAMSTDRIGRTVAAVSPATIDRNLGVDARGGALTIAEFARRHIARRADWGRIVSLTSGGPQGFPEEVSYGAAKAALENYTMAAATELAPYGITANIVYPPVTDTGWVTDAVREFVAHSPEHVRVAEPADIAEVITWLCTDAARHITGTLVRLR
jgi:3-oxoacyl-[acyl-carrier protein] reductase